VTKFGRSLPKYPEDFKKAVVKEIIQGNERISRIADRHGIAARSIYRWLDRYGSEFSSILDTNQVQEQMSKLSEKKEDKKEHVDLTSHVEQLEEALRLEKLKRVAYEDLIRLAEEHYKISIKKKFGTKRFRE